MKEKIKRKDLKYKTKNYTYDFKQNETVTAFGDNIYIGKIDIDEAEMD